MKLILFILLNIILYTGNISAQQDSSGNYYNPGLNDLVNSALNSNSKLLPIEYEKKILSANISSVNKQSSPMLQFMVDLLPVDFSNAGEYSVSYSQPLKLFGKLDEQERLARIKSGKPLLEKRELEIELVRSVKENYFMLSLNEKLSEFNKEFQKIMKSISSSIEIQYSTGKGNQYEILKSNNELQKLLLEEIDLRNIRNIFINNLSTLSNELLSENFKTKNIDILLKIDPPVLDSAVLIKDMNSNNIEFQYLEQLNKENISEKNIAELERKPDLELMSGYKYMSDSKENFLLFSVLIDLPFMPWNSKRIDAMLTEKLLMEKKISAEYRSLETNLGNELRNNIVKINSSLEKINYIRSILIPQTEQVFKSSLISYETSSAGFIDLLDTYRQLRENNQMLFKEEIDYLISVSELEKLTGKQILTIN
ncbi:MAG: TolC family protein [Ignavibacteria bacterium]|nr:TolC family protein [Ignavibacteria bacterium]